MINEYLTYLKDNRNLSDNTIEGYNNDLRQFVKYAAAQGLRWSTIRKQHIEDFLAQLKRSDIAPTSINRKLSSIRGLMTWANHNGMIPTNPSRWIRAQKTEEKLPVAANKELLERYLATSPSTYQARIVHALISLLMDTGIRIQEAIDLRIEDVNTQQRTIMIHGKGRRERIVYYTELTERHCGLVGNMRPHYLIPISDQRTLRYMIYSELKGANIHPHAIRHLFATNLLENGADINVISKLLGHKSVKTTERYAKVSDSTMRTQYYQYH